MLSGDTSFPSPGAGNDCRPLGPNTQKQLTGQVEGPVETPAIPVVPGTSLGPRERARLPPPLYPWILFEAPAGFLAGC